MCAMERPLEETVRGSHCKARRESSENPPVGLDLEVKETTTRGHTGLRDKSMEPRPGCAHTCGLHFSHSRGDGGHLRKQRCRAHWEPELPQEGHLRT